MENFIQWLKEETLAGVWSKGVQLSRASKGIELLSGGPDVTEWKFKIQTTERTLAYQVTLWPDDEDAHCNCDSKIEPCHHIVAVALAWQSGQISRSEERTGTRIHYRWVVQNDEISLKRSIITRTEKGEETSSPLTSSLVALIGGIQSGRIKMPIPPTTPQDLRIDEICAQREVSWKDLLKTLQDLNPLEVEGLPGVQTLTVRKGTGSAWIEIKDVAGGVTLSLEGAAAAPDRTLKNKLALWGDQLGIWDGSAQIFETKTVASDELAHFVLNQLPPLRDRFEVRIETQKLPEVVDVEPFVEWNIQPLGTEQVSVTPLISYGKLPIGKVARRNSRREQELMKDLQSRFQMSVQQPVKLDPREAFLFREKVQHPTLDHFLTDTLSELKGVSVDIALKHKESILHLLSLKKNGRTTGASATFAENLKDLILGSEQKGEAVELESLPIKIARPLWDTLRDYQKQGVKWLADHFHKKGGAILADDMGLGKTIQTLSVLQGPSLIVVPTSLIDNWVTESKRFRPDLKVAVYHGSAREWDEQADLIVTTYGLLRQEPSRFLDRDWQSVVLDEAHLIRNADTQAAIVACRLRSQTRLALTGTPIQNRARDLWSLFQFLSPDLFPTEESMKREWIAPFILRRTKAEVLKELPPKTYLEHSVELSETERALYQSVWAAAKKEIIQRLDAQEHNPLTLFEVLLRARQVCDHARLVGDDLPRSAKLNELMEIVTELTEAGHSVLVYSQWTKFLDQIEIALKPTTMEYLRLDGSTQNRGAVLEKFQSSVTPKVFLLSLHAGGVGLNLTHADHVIFCDPWWNPYVELQAEDRAYRMGQDKPVTIHRLICRDSIEEKIRELQAEKRKLEKDYLDLDSAVTRSNLSMADLENLLVELN